jgi:predicted transcriptional regulator
MDKDEKIVDALSKVVNRQEAKVLVYLKRHKSATGIDIEREMGMRQPEVSIATGGLLDKKLIVASEEKRPGARGRPKIRYSMDERKVREFLSSMIDSKKDDIGAIEDAIGKF